MYCEKCGAKLSDDTVFCGHCGQRVDAANNTKAIRPDDVKKNPRTPDKQNNQTPKESRFRDGICCEECGAKLSMDATFCEYCGQKIGKRATSRVIQPNNVERRRENQNNQHRQNNRNNENPGKPKKHRVWLIVLIIIAIVAAFAVGGYLLYRSFHTTGFSDTDAEAFSDMDADTFTYVQAPQQDNASESTEDQDNASETDSASEELTEISEQPQKKLSESLCITSFDATTSMAGNTSYDFGKKVIVLTAWSTRTDTVVFAYPTKGTEDSGASLWWFHVRNTDTLESVAENTSLTISVCYIDVQKASEIDELHFDSFSGTTSTAGNISLECEKNMTVLSAWSTRSDTLVLGYPTSGTLESGASLWWFHVRESNNDEAVLANTEVTITVCYVEGEYVNQDSGLQLKTFTDSTSTSGNVSCGFDQDVIVLSAWCSRGDTLICPYPTTGTDVSGAALWWFHVQNSDVDKSAAPNMSAAISICYVVASDAEQVQSSALNYQPSTGPSSSPAPSSTPTPPSTPSPQPELSHVVEDAWSGECVYSVNDGQGGRSTKTAVYHVPKINLSFSNIDSINQEILERFASAQVDRDADYSGTNNMPEFARITYEWSLHANILSLLVSWEATYDDGICYDLYTLSIENGGIVSSEEIRRISGMSVEEYNNKVKASLGSEFWNVGNGYALNDINSDTWEMYETDLESTISEENIAAARPYFNADEHLCILGTVYFPVQIGRIHTTIDLETYTISPYYVETIPKPEDAPVPDNYSEDYSRVLQSNYTSNGTARFFLLNLNNDDTPELFVATGNAHPDHIEIFTFFEGGSIYAGSVGSFGKAYYDPEHEVIISSYANQGGYSTSVFALDGIELSEQYSISGIIGGEILNASISGQPVAEDQFGTVSDIVNSYNADKAIGFEVGWDINAENIAQLKGDPIAFTIEL